MSKLITIDIDNRNRSKEKTVEVHLFAQNCEVYKIYFNDVLIYSNRIIVLNSSTLRRTRSMNRVQRYKPKKQ